MRLRLSGFSSSRCFDQIAAPSDRTKRGIKLFGKHVAGVAGTITSPVCSLLASNIACTPFVWFNRRRSMSFAPQPHFGIQNCVHLLPCCAHFGDDDTHRGHGFDVVAVEITGCWKHRAKLIVALHQLKETESVCFTHVTFRCLRWAASIAANGSGCQRLMPRSSISFNSRNAGLSP